MDCPLEQKKWPLSRGRHLWRFNCIYWEPYIICWVRWLFKTVSLFRIVLFSVTQVTLDMYILLLTLFRTSLFTFELYICYLSDRCCFWDIRQVFCFKSWCETRVHQERRNFSKWLGCSWKGKVCVNSLYRSCHCDILNRNCCW